MKKWVNVKIVNQVGSRVKIKADKILPSAVLSSGEIFVYHRLLNGTDRKATATLKAIDEYTDKPLTINGEHKFTVTPTTYDDTQEAYVSREGERRMLLHKRTGKQLTIPGVDSSTQFLLRQRLGRSAVSVNSRNPLFGFCFIPN